MGEKVTNGTCETWASATDLTSWTETLGGSTTIDREATEQYSGTYCLKIDVDGSKSLSRIAQNITLVADNPYLLTFWYKGSETSGTLLHCGLADSANNVWLNGSGAWKSIGTYDGGFTVDHTTTWTQKKVVFTAHASYTAYVLNILNCAHSDGVASCQIYVDNISITDALIDHESDGITLADVGGSGRQTVFDSVSVKDDFKYYLASSEGKIFTYSGDYLSDDGSVILSRWRSKTLDFSDQIPQCLDRMKEVTGVKLIYKDITTATNVTVYVSSDGGATWEHETKSLGTGTGEILSATYSFIKSGEYFIFAIEHASTDKEFMWLRMEADVVPLGPYIEI